MDIRVSDFIKRKYHLIIYVGTDITKFNLYADIISSDSKILIDLSNFLITMMASICCFPNYHHLPKTATSYILNQQYTAMALLLAFSKASILKCVLTPYDTGVSKVCYLGKTR